MRKVYNLYADFETTYVPIPKQYENYKTYLKSETNPTTPIVDRWGIGYDSPKINIDGFNKDEWKNTYFHTGTNFDNFLRLIESIKFDAIMYFNNLKGYDGHFLFPLLDKCGYENIYDFDIDPDTPQYSEMRKQRIKRIKRDIFNDPKLVHHRNNIYARQGREKAELYINKIIKNRWNLLFENEYKMIVDNDKAIYEIRIGLPAIKKSNRHRVLIIRDNLLLFPASIKYQGELLSKHHQTHFKMDKMIADEKYHKKESDYKSTKVYKTYEEFRNDKIEYKYLLQDIFILVEYHKLIGDFFHPKDWKMTISATSYNLWEKHLGQELIDKGVENNNIKAFNVKNGAINYDYKGKDYNSGKLSKVLIKEIIPTKWMDKEINGAPIHNLLYEWYDGGITKVSEEFRGQLVTDVSFIDIHSSYPSQMVKNTMVPVGEGLKGNVKEYPFKLYTLIPKKDIINKSGLPFLYDKTCEKREHQRVLKTDGIYKFSSLSLPYFKKYYNANKEDYDLTISWSFQQAPISFFYKSFIEKWYKIKQNAKLSKEKVIELLAKLFLNSLYGKKGTKKEREGKIWDQHNHSFINVSEEMTSRYYLPLAIAITELARLNLVDAVDINYEKFVYCDTDSLAIKDFNPQDFKNITLHNNKLGTWGYEFKNGYGIFRRAKQYLLLNDEGENKLAYAGINYNRYFLGDKDLDKVDKLEYKIYEKEVSLVDFVLGKTIDNQMRPIKLSGGGILLDNINKTIKPVWNYEQLPEQKYFKHTHFNQTIEDIIKLEKDGRNIVYRG